MISSADLSSSRAFQWEFNSHGTLKQFCMAGIQLFYYWLKIDGPCSSFTAQIAACGFFGVFFFDDTLGQISAWLRSLAEISLKIPSPFWQLYTYLAPLSAVGVLHTHIRIGLVIERTAFQLCQVRPGFPQAVSPPQKFHCQPSETWGTGLQQPQWTVDKSHGEHMFFRKGGAGSLGTRLLMI